MFKIIKKVLIIMFIAILVGVGSIALTFFNDSKHNEKESKENVIIEVEQGESVTSIANKLKENEIIKYPKFFIRYGRTYEKVGNIKFGLHAVNKQMSYDELYEAISSSEMSLEVYNKVTIPEGFTVNQIADRLSENNMIDKDAFLLLAKEGDFDFWFLKDIEVNGGEYKLEGFMYPQTYYFEKNATEEQIIVKLLEEFEKNTLEYKEKYTSKEFYNVLKMASIIERETFIDKEKDVVAGVFYNRLNKGIKLESCATVEYVLNTRKKVLSYEDISIDSPYNTYKNEGLTPTPISNPSLSSIKAAANPTETEYMFFVANKDGNGHVFSVTYDEHLKNIDKYR